MTETKHHFHAQAQLACGTWIEITQPEPNMNISVTVTPKDGIQVSDFADLKDGKLNLRLTIESLLGLYQLLHMISVPQKRRKILGIF